MTLNNKHTWSCIQQTKQYSPAELRYSALRRPIFQIMHYARAEDITIFNDSSTVEQLPNNGTRHH